MPTFIDQTGNTLTFNKRPERVISIVPSQSEFLYAIGLQNNLIGITKFCIHPDKMFKSVERIGGTKNLNIEKIRALKPDLIIANKEENERWQIEILQKEFNVWISDIYNFEDAFVMMSELGKITKKKEAAQKIITEIKKTLPAIKNIFNKETAIYFIWNKPYMIAAQNTFIDHVLNYIGILNSAHNLHRYPELTNEALIKIEPQFCFLSSEPFPFKEKHVKEMQKLLPNTKIKIVDGEMFSWYGSRLTKLPSYIKQLHKELLR